jgi:hypothetical protein
MSSNVSKWGKRRSRLQGGVDVSAPFTDFTFTACAASARRTHCCYLKLLDVVCPADRVGSRLLTASCTAARPPTSHGTTRPPLRVRTPCRVADELVHTDDFHKMPEDMTLNRATYLSCKFYVGLTVDPPKTS